MEKMRTAVEAVDRLIELYQDATTLGVQLLERDSAEGYDQVVYPKLIVDVEHWRPIDRTEPFGYVDKPGRYAATLSRPAMMRGYLLEMLDRLTSNYPCTIHVGPSEEQIPPEYIDDAPTIERSPDSKLPRPSLDAVDDAIIDGEWSAFHGEELPLFHFSAQRFDLACKRIEHYTGLPVESVQKFILFTNYQMHTTEFVSFGRSAGGRYTSLEVPREGVQMPRYDLCTEAGDGITMINIGVGPSNAKTITDCLAVLRPECWVMIGHCAGLDGRMRIGDLILGNAYQRHDHVLDGHLPGGVPIPAVPEVQRALEAAVRNIYGDDAELMRTGTVLSTDDRNWEWHTPKRLWKSLRGSTAVAVDMESSALAANGYRYRIPYGTLLSVSDLPLHAVPKLPAGAQSFYKSSKEAHVMCAVRAVEALAAEPDRLQTRKLRRTIGEVPFR
ncbi:AMP nucleosidase [Corynebacterium kalinowskii]|uniref:AMP nucleosidase n=1 Tax=Corynebacterium kalinowskii TaxID=2675216 RepID=A0A6B8VQH5_9CORY|nr:AMP nucleosidase [Corynebacterium kalinowskii]QGU01026.1 AMP nucleosidase [Corynebacterium kalinowskii]